MAQRIINLAKAELWRCVKCWGTTNVERHHKGRELLFSQLLPEFYAERYKKFLKEDCVLLCNGRHSCHKRIHRLYNRRSGDMWALIAKQGGRLTHAQAERFRKRFVGVCDEWLNRPAGERLKSLQASRRQETPSAR